MAVIPAQPAEHHGQVAFNGIPVPGATVIAAQGDKKITTVTDLEGAYTFPDLPDGAWSIEVQMQAFAAATQEIAVAPNAAAAQFDLKILPLAEIKAEVAEPAPVAAPPTAATTAAAAAPAQRGRRNAPRQTPTNTQSAFQRANLNASTQQGQAAQPPPSTDSTAGDNADSNDLNQRAADGLMINGTQNNGASSPFALNQAFGNNRRGGRSLYNGALGITVGNSALDARTYSLTGQDTPKPGYNHLTGNISFGGPMRIPGLLRNGPNFFIAYQGVRDRRAVTQSGLVPTAAERSGDLSAAPGQIFDPRDGAPFQGNIIAPNRISPQAKALLALFPLPNFTASSQYNYQIPVVSGMHQDSLQSRANKTIGRKNQVSGTFALQSTRGDNPSLFGFLDTSRVLGINAAANWRHTFTPRFFTNFGYQFSRQSTHFIPFFQNRQNISALAGISGNNQEAVNWGPPGLNFSSGLSPLADAVPSLNRNQTSAVSYDSMWSRSRHNLTFGADFRRQQFNILSQQDPRGSFTFTGASTRGASTTLPQPGNRFDFAGFLLGIPDTSSIAFGNADKYFRANSYDAYISDDWRMSPSFTLNAGVRWEYWAPITELYGRLVNLDIAPGFAGAAPVVASDPVGPLTHGAYPDSLIQPDKQAFQPRIGISWRPFPASSMVIRGGYGVYYNTSVYQSIATQMAQQSPLSKSLSVQNTPANPLTLANGFIASSLITTNTFAVDPDLQVGYSQNWQLSIQRDLPASLQMMVQYQGSKGTRGLQAFLPNTYPAGFQNPCSLCPSGYIYMASNGNSTRHAGQFQLRRRLHNGFTATAQYTYSKSIDDASLGGRAQTAMVIAQDWLNLSGERGLSSFDQRHLGTLQVQYTSGLGIAGGTLLGGWKGALMKEWTLTSQINAGTGFPLTPVYPSAVRGTGVTGPVRPDFTGISVYDAPSGLNLNPAAYTSPASGKWGNAGRNSITGPSQFTLNASLARTFRLSDRVNFDLRVDANNALNHVTYPSWVATVGSAQFGLPATANAMRNVQTTLRLRF